MLVMLVMPTGLATLAKLAFIFYFFTKPPTNLHQYRTLSDPTGMKYKHCSQLPIIKVCKSTTATATATTATTSRRLHLLRGRTLP